MQSISRYWTKKQIRRQLHIVSGEEQPTAVIENGTYLNSMRKIWQKGHIWLDGSRIVYVGEALPSSMDGIERIDAEGFYLVPGYIEHHAHPFQLYNPLTLARFGAERGTTTFVNDNLPFILHLETADALRLIEEIQQTPAVMLWWARYDGQTALINQHHIFSYSAMKAWLDHPYVVQGGELTDWPGVLEGNDEILHWMLETKQAHKPIEGHLPGAGKETLAKMALLGVDGDHESMTAEDVLARLDAGMTASLRYSSIRPDLPAIISGLQQTGKVGYDDLMMTTDGSPPHFIKEGLMDMLIDKAVAAGVPFIDAVLMCTKNPARYFHLDDTIGIIAPGRLANINFLPELTSAKPTDVLAKGEWVRKDNRPVFPKRGIDWASFGFTPFNPEWELTWNDLHFSIPLGVEMVNEVIMKPYQIQLDMTGDSLPDDCDECFLLLVDRFGKWSVTTLIKGFAAHIYGFASSYSTTGDIILIGKSKHGLLQAFQALKKQRGGIVLLDQNGPAASIPLTIGGTFSEKPIDGGLTTEENHLRAELFARCYPFNDPIYSLLFLSSTHLPYVRVTQKGIYDVKKKRVLFPSIMR
ncbi:adenine deaminase C-terminal domain-containing protein [Salisediminibacterium halotolerans]|uniref:adenine deaminase C-terminal domain-containing protein n=1 Tax=Salisediminibacterium halotolerans TaxID=517425 RepID=UPI000EAEB40D|nr:adenine deaminase C-terminal domain-containing protein [Salisediminibacterium halotolerans]RLJ71772.1 adenine deaminase [Actinophytocola xinjiangensis]RPE86922.1 adenine deaminase [Salisediminibacterium halotolerans]TWG32985.1 adenine deaminase [Salisediminibacterium halotolerans]GEL08544.1 putative adenine deaminase YerA [Salisediminibacterium halotolerans]